MARCNDCNRFVSYDDSNEPEVDSLEVDSQSITGSIRIYLTCAECGTELRESNFDVEVDISEDFGEEHEGEGHDLDVDFNDLELTTHTNDKDAKGKTIPYRFRKTFYGYSGNFDVRCKCGKTETYDVADSVQASHMDEI